MGRLAAVIIFLFFPHLASGAHTCTASLTTFGAVPDGVTNNATAIQNTFNYAASHHCIAQIPAGSFAYSGTVTATGVAVHGDGASSILLPTNTANEALILSGNNVSASNFAMRSYATLRLTTPWSGMIWAYNATNYSIQNILINGSSSIGIMSYNSTRGTISGNTVENSLADSITQIVGSSSITISGNRILNSGDDGISNVSYVGNPIVSNITVKGNTILNNLGGRGMSVVGGSNVVFESNYVDNPDGFSDIYIASESQWGTLGVSGATASGNALFAGGPDQGMVTVYNSQGTTYKITGVTISGNQMIDPPYVAFQFVGDGLETAVVENNTDYSSNAFDDIASDPLAHGTFSNNKVLTPSAYTKAIVTPGGGCNFSGC
jgi:Right handed beta helix region